MAKVLTAAGVKKLTPKAQRREVRDGGTPGLYVVIEPSGRKTWSMRFRRPVPVANQIRAYWWCRPPRTGRHLMRPTD